MFDKLFSFIKEEICEQQPKTKPETPTKPVSPPVEPKKKPYPSTPIKPAPGIHPKPKAEANIDLELFKKLRKERITEMAFDPGEHPQFIHPTKKRWIETGDEELNRLLPTLGDSEQSYLELIASRTYQDMIDRLEKYTNLSASNLSVPQLYSLVMQAFKKVVEIEKDRKRELEKMALDLVLDMPEFKMVKEAYEGGEVEFDIELGEAELSPLSMEVEEEGLSNAEEINLKLASAFENLDDQKLRRRLANFLIQGGAMLKMYLFNMVKDKLDAIDNSLVNLYGILGVVSQLGYWIFVSGAESSEMATASVEVIPEGREYVIKARGIVFPFLVHELAKGIYEWISLDPDLQAAMEEDTLEKETEGLMVGPGIFQTLSFYIPTNKQHLTPLVHKKFLKLSQDAIKDVLARNDKGKGIMHRLIRQAEEDWKYYEDEKKRATIDTYFEGEIE